MTAAPESLTALPRAAYASSDARTLRHWERALIVLAVCLPVPVFAATGLSIPLPSTVERLAAALVPWADTASFDENEAATVGADGTIVLAPQELGATLLAQDARAAAVAPTRDEPATKSDRKQTKKSGGAKGDGTVAGGGGASGSGGGSGSGGTSTGGGGDSGSSSGPVQSVVDQTTQATQPVVGAVEETVEETVGGVVEGVGKTVGGVLPVQGP